MYEHRNRVGRAGYEEHSETTMPVSLENLSWIIGKEK